MPITPLHILIPFLFYVFKNFIIVLTINVFLGLIFRVVYTKRFSKFLLYTFFTLSFLQYIFLALFVDESNFELINPVTWVIVFFYLAGAYLTAYVGYRIANVKKPSEKE